MIKNYHRFWIIGTIALILGSIIYILFRPQTYIAQWFSNYAFIQTLQDSVFKINNDFLRFYFPDYLWGLSLSCYLHSLFHPRISGSVLCSGISILYGTLLELIQFFNIISGTGDICDILMFILAGATAMIINIPNLKETQK